MTVTIIGFGEVGSLTAGLLNAAFTDLSINIIDFEDKLSGRILDFKHAVAARKNSVHVNNNSLLKQSDFLIYAAGHSNAKGESRLTVATKNKELINSIFKHIELKHSCKVLVVTNPVEAATFWVYLALNKKNLVFGTGTALDTFRLKYLLADHFNCSINEVETIVLGEHGSHMTPIYSRTTIQGKLIGDLVSESTLLEIKEKLVNSATQIRKTENATKYGVAETCLTVIQGFIVGKLDLPLSTISETVSNLPPEFAKSSVLSVPVRFDGAAIDYPSINASKEEIRNIVKGIESIESII